MTPRKIPTSRSDGGPSKRTRNSSNSLINMEPEIGNVSQDFSNKEPTSNASIDGKKYSIPNSSKAHG